jgi:hypothetical protein
MGHRKLIEIKPNFFIEPVPVDDDACVRDLNNPASAFTQYLLPRLKEARDEASEEVLALVKAGEGLGEAVAITIQNLSASKTRRLRAWTDEALSSHVYAYAQMLPGRRGQPSFLVVGLVLTEGGPGDEILQRSTAKQFHATNYAPYRTEASLGSWIRLRFASPSTINPTTWIPPMVEVASEEQYDAALALLGLSGSAWELPGIYDFENFRRSLPSYVGTVAEYEHAAARALAEKEINTLLGNPSLLETTCRRLRSLLP